MGILVGGGPYYSLLFYSMGPYNLSRGGQGVGWEGNYSSGWVGPYNNMKGVGKGRSRGRVGLEGWPRPSFLLLENGGKVVYYCGFDPYHSIGSDLSRKGIRGHEPLGLRRGQVGSGDRSRKEGPWS